MATSLPVIGGPASANPDLSTQARHSGEELLLGLFFGYGPVAEEYPDLVVVETEESGTNQQVVAELVAEVDRQSPAFLGSFATAMYSGDRVVIEQAADEAARMLHEATESLYPEATTVVDADDANGLCLAIVQVAAVTIVALAAVVAVAVVTVVSWGVSVAWYWIQDIALGNQTGALTRERWVDSVATTLNGI